MTTVELGGGKRYRVHGLRWSGPDSRVVRLLNRFRPVYGPSEPSVELAEADRAVAALGGEVVRVGADLDFEPDLSY